MLSIHGTKRSVAVCFALLLLFRSRVHANGFFRVLHAVYFYRRRAGCKDTLCKHVLYYIQCDAELMNLWRIVAESG